MVELTRTHVDRWLFDYVKAWKTYDRDRIGALFSIDAEYRYHPYDRTSPWDETIGRVYYNCYVMEFDDEGLSKRFTEWFVKKRPDPEPSPSET